MESFTNVLRLLSDEVLVNFIEKALTDYTILSAMFGGAALWLLRKYTAFTPWKSDDAIVEKITDRFNNILGGGKADAS